MSLVPSSCDNEAQEPPAGARHFRSLLIFGVVVFYTTNRFGVPGKVDLDNQNGVILQGH